MVNNLILSQKYNEDQIRYINKFMEYSIQDIIATLELSNTSAVISNKIALSEIYNLPL